MDARESVEKEVRDIERCPTRAICPFGLFCGMSRSGDGKPFLPKVISLKKGERMWTNLRYENQVYVIRKGVFVSTGQTADEYEVPCAILGTGNSLGLAEIFTPEEIGDYYYIRNLIPGEACSIPAKRVRRKLDELSRSHSNQIICGAFVSLSFCSFLQAKILSMRSLYDRILALLLCLQDLMGRQGVEPTALEITHEEIAALVASDRVSVTRLLHKMHENKIVSLGYKAITLHSDKLGGRMKMFDAHSYFVTLEEESEHLKESCLLPRRSPDEEDPFIML